MLWYQRMRSTILRNDELPLITAVIPVKNGERYIAAAIDSLLAQLLAPREIIIVDDGSEDQTAQVVQKFGRRVTFVKSQRSGTAAARNVGVKSARHPLVAFLDADDICHPERLLQQAQQLDMFPRAALGFCAFTYFLENDSMKSTPIGCPGYTPEKILGLMFERNQIGSASLVMARKAFLESIGGFDETFEAHCEDYDLWLRLARRHQICYLEQALVDVRLHHENTSSRKGQQTKNEIKALKKHSFNSIETALSLAYPNELEAALALVCVFFRMADYTAAQATLKSLQNLDKTHHLIAFYLGNLALLNGHYGKAEMHFKQSLSLNRKFAPAQNNLGVSLAMLGNVSSAYQSFDAAVRDLPAFRDPAWNLTILEQKIGFEKLKTTMVPLRPVLRPEPMPQSV